jgi:hypothetical protein
MGGFLRFGGIPACASTFYNSVVRRPLTYNPSGEFPAFYPYVTGPFNKVKVLP